MKYYILLGVNIIFIFIIKSIIIALESDELVCKLSSYRCLSDGFIKTGAK